MKNWSAEFRSVLKSLPAEYAEARATAQEASHVFHQELAVAIGPSMNKKLKAMPQSSYEERQSLASWCNHELHDLRLCIRWLSPRGKNAADAACIRRAINKERIVCRHS